MKKNKKSYFGIYLAIFSVLIVVAIFVSFIIFWIGRAMTEPGGMEFLGQYGDSFGVLNSLFSGLGFSVIIITLMSQQRQIRNQSEKDSRDAEERRSLFNLRSFEEANFKAMELLKDGNNDRAIWIRAARLLGHANALSEGVTVENHRRVMEYKSLEYRTFFRELLEGKSGSFFYGTPYNNSPLDAAAIASTSPVRSGGRSVYGNTALSESSIFAVVTAAEWPENYIDPIDGGFTDENTDKKTFLYDGLREFLYHRKEWISYGGQLKKRR